MFLYYHSSVFYQFLGFGLCMCRYNFVFVSKEIKLDIFWSLFLNVQSFFPFLYMCFVCLNVHAYKALQEVFCSKTFLPNYVQGKKCKIASCQLSAWGKAIFSSWPFAVFYIRYNPRIRPRTKFFSGTNKIQKTSIPDLVNDRRTDRQTKAVAAAGSSIFKG